MIKNIKSVGKAKIVLLKLCLLYSSFQLIQANQYEKIVQSQSNYPEDDLYNYNIMNGSYFDNRPFQNKEEKYNFIAHHFKHMHIRTDINDELLFMLVQSNYSRQQFYKLMHIAEKVAKNQGFQYIGLNHLERGFRYLKGVLFESDLKDFYNPRIHKTAYHEAGHTFELINKDTGHDLVWASIQPDKKTWGHVLKILITEHLNEQQLKNNISMKLAGGIAVQKLEKLTFKNYNETLRDFFQGGTRSDWFSAKKIAKHLALIQAQDKQADCLWSSSKDLYKDLTCAEDFFDTYKECANVHLHEKVIDKYASAIIREQYHATEVSVAQAEPIIKAIAQELLDKKVVSGKRIREIVKNEKLKTSNF